MKKRIVILFSPIFFVLNKVKQNADKEFNKKSWDLYILLSITTSIIIIGFTNLGFYPAEDISRSLVFIAILLLFIIYILRIIKKLCVNVVYFKQIFIYGILFIGAIVLYKRMVWGGADIPTIVRIIMFTCTFVLFYFMGGIKFINIILFVYVLGFMLIGSYNNYDSQQNFLLNINNDSNDFILKEKPNFYYLLCESMNSVDVAINEYGVDRNTLDNFISFLKDNGFFCSRPYLF